MQEAKAKKKLNDKAALTQELSSARAAGRTLRPLFVKMLIPRITSADHQAKLGTCLKLPFNEAMAYIARGQATEIEKSAFDKAAAAAAAGADAPMATTAPDGWSE